jgi:two-component system, chemotaxis family, chemotaxis protein CheY
MASSHTIYHVPITIYYLHAMSKKVLIVDDSPLMQSLLKAVLEIAGYEIVGQATTGEQAISMAIDTQPDVITIDNLLPDMNGIEVLKRCQLENLASRILFISGIDQSATIQEGIKLGAIGYLVKPFANHQLLRILNAQPAC